MRTRTRWLVRLAPLLLLLLFVGAWFLWGSWRHRRLLERLETLEHDGEPVSWSQMAPEGAPLAGNGALLLLQAHGWAEQVEMRFIEEGLGPVDDPIFIVPGYRPGEPWTDAERQGAMEALDILEPYYDQLDAALVQPTIVFPVKGPYDSPHVNVVQGAVVRLGTVGAYNPAAWPEVLDRVVGLLDRWVPRNALEITLSWVLWRASGTRWLQRLLADAVLPPDPLLERWGPALARADASTTARFQLQVRCGRVFLLGIVWAWSGGEDPFAEARESIREVRETLDELPNAGGDETGRPIADIFRALEGMAPENPLQSRWYGRPLLWHGAIANLDEDEHWIEGTADLDEIRATLLDRIAADQGTSRQALDAKQALHVVATLRLARIALAIHDHVLEHGAAPAALADVADRLGGAVEADPLTGRPFVYEREEGVAVVATDPDNGLWREIHWVNKDPLNETPRQQLEDAALLWRIPTGP